MTNKQKMFAEAADKNVDKKLRGGVWEVFDEYKLVLGRTGRGAGQRYVKTNMGVKRRVKQRVYRPLVDTPALFLEFAMLVDDPGLSAEVDAEGNAEVYLEWVHTHGTLGFEPSSGHKR